MSPRARVALVVAVAALIASSAFVVLDLGHGGASARIEVAKVWSDKVNAPAGMVYYLLDVNASSGGPSGWDLDPSRFTLTSNASVAYPPASAYNGTATMQKTFVAGGAHVLGEVAFELPATQAPARIEYADPAGGISLESDRIPQVSGIASRFDPSVHYSLNGASWADTIPTWAAIANQSSALAFFSGVKADRNRTFTFFTGQKIYVSFAFYYYKRPMDPQTIVVESITSDDGYAVSSASAWQTSFGFAGYGPAPLPATMSGYGSNLEVTLVVTVPPGPQQGVLHFTVQFAAG